MFKRDEVYDLLVQLTGQAMLRLLKNAGGDAPGASNSPSDIVDNQTTVAGRALDGGQLISPLKQDLAAKKRNHSFCLHFRLPLTEELIDTLEVTYMKPHYTKTKSGSPPPEKTLYQGRLYLSGAYITFESMLRLPQPQQHQPICWLVFPLYTIRRVERLNTGSYVSALSISTWHKMEHIFQLHVKLVFHHGEIKKDGLIDAVSYCRLQRRHVNDFVNDLQFISKINCKPRLSRRF
ncbi:uncharacterized protein BYT42DRAFT_13531 [Radiomyces spectabilis]|uniref:uncharacterized protein n=1 Tax=Radiomyces spectabilis TaxID=64574 RepID=UPI00221F946C|nr:uncharacterized protein BYT42DRAFT_13531 [Radiomyces spectabilis]KAI8393628.1 hypothetical protein BYT42DRAFT_13531 [Radiomyces spectabilis]